VLEPAPKANEVLVRVLAAFVNDWDYTESADSWRRFRVEAVGNDVRRSSRMMRSTAICA
jgi:hypothetical protein